VKLLSKMKNIKHKKIVTSVAIGIALTGAGVASAATIQTQTNNAAEIVEEQVEAVEAVEIKEMKKIEEEPAKPVEAPQNVPEQPTETVTVQAETTQEPEQRQFKFAAEMAAAGIAEADYGLASDFLLNDDGWIRAGAQAWTKGATCWFQHVNIVHCLMFAKQEVDTLYGGSWQTARSKWRTVQMDIDNYNRQQNQ
jgi:hypothetical protein